MTIVTDTTSPELPGCLVPPSRKGGPVGDEFIPGIIPRSGLIGPRLPDPFACPDPSQPPSKKEDPC